MCGSHERESARRIVGCANTANGPTSSRPVARLGGAILGVLGVTEGIPARSAGPQSKPESSVQRTRRVSHSCVRRSGSGKKTERSEAERSSSMGRAPSFRMRLGDWSRKSSAELDYDGKEPPQSSMQASCARARESYTTRVARVPAGATYPPC